MWLLTPMFGAQLGLPMMAKRGERCSGGLMATFRTWRAYILLFLPGAIVGGIVGWLIIRPGELVLGEVLRRLQLGVRSATDVYGRVVGWSLRLSAIVLLIYVGLIGLTGFGFTRVPSGFIPTRTRAI